MSEPIDKDLPDEQQLDDYLKGGSSVSQQYRQLRSAEVPAELDRFVLSQAHDAVKSTRPAKSRTWMRWTAPLALAASAVLVVSIVIETGVQDEVMLSAPSPAPAAAPVEAKRKREAAESDASGNAAIEMRMPESAAQAPGFVPPAEVIEAPTQPSAPPPPQMDIPSRAELDRVQRVAPVAPPPRAMAGASQPQVPEQVVVNARAFKEAEQALARQGMTSTAIQKNSAAPDASVAAPAPEFAADAVVEEEKSQALQQYSDPELWLRDIRQLRRENKKEAADKEWRRFRAAFPDYVVEEGDTAREVK